MHKLGRHGIRLKTGPVLRRGTQAHVVLARKQALDPLLATRNVQAHLRSGMTQAKGGNEARGKSARSGIGPDPQHAERSRASMAEAIERLARAGVAFQALTAVGSPAERIAAVAEAEQVDEILMGVGRHPQWLRWLNPSIAQGMVARTDIPVAVIARGKESAFERYVVPAGIAGIAALLIAVE